MEYGIKVNNIKKEDINALRDKIWEKNTIEKGEVLNGVITGIKPYGAFVRLENGMEGLIHIEDISVARIKSPSERLKIGQNVNVVVKYIDREQKRINLSYKEMFGTWEENAKKFEIGSKVIGKVRETEKSKNGIFIELTPNLVGMAEYREGLEYGENVQVYIKNIIPEKKKVKLVIL